MHPINGVYIAREKRLAALEEPPVAPIPADGDSVLERKRNAMAAPARSTQGDGVLAGDAQRK